MVMLNPQEVRRYVIYVLCGLIVLSLFKRIFDLYSIKDGDEGVSKVSSHENLAEGGNLFGLRMNDQYDLSQKLDDLAERLLEQQERRLLKLEDDKNRLERQLNEMKKPANELTLREKLAFIYPYDQNQKFPAYVWQTWKYGLNDDRFGENYKRGEEQWALMNPGFVHELFNDDTSNAIVRYLYMNIPEVIKAYDSLPHVILKIDFFKYLILFAKGGVYADVDTLPVQPIPNWIPENVDPSELGMIIGIGSDPITKDWRRFYSRRLQFGNWVIQAKPGHPILREIIASITETTLARMQNNDLNIRSDQEVQNFKLDVMNWTGEGVWTDVVLRYFNDYVLSGIFSKVTWKDFTKMDVPKLVSDVLILPVNSFGVEDENKNHKENTQDADAVDVDYPPNAVEGDESHPLAFVKHYSGRLYERNH